MKKLYTFNLSERPLAGLFKEALQREGVDCIVRNEQLFSALGEIPFIECYPELWVVDDECYPRAHSLLRQLMAGGGEGEQQAGWTCSKCGETHEGQFDTCWRCGKERPAG
ncbi:MAG: hypothetical protein C0615_10865 [Desulfuromonas sp.]|nr:MAG: hypothetical protein C0615_10865 [Desulfuromonas sp.]